MLERPNWLDSEFLILINNEEEYNQISLILHSYGFKHRGPSSFKRYMSYYYYLRIEDNEIFQGSLYENLISHKKRIKQILTYNDFINL